MGCVVSDESGNAGQKTSADSKYADGKKDGKTGGGAGAAGTTGGGGAGAGAGAGAGGAGSTAAPQKVEETGAELQGRQRFIEDIGAAVLTVGERSSIASLFLLSCPRGSKHGIMMSYLNAQQNTLFSAEISDEELGKQKISQNISYPWSALFKSMTSETLKGKTKTNESGGDTVTAEFAIVSVRDKTKLPFKLTLRKIAATPENRHKFIIEPMSRMVQKRRQVSEEREREIKTSRLQTQLQLQEFSIALHRATIDRLKPQMGNLREESASFAKVSAELTSQIGRAERRIKLVERGRTRNELDDMYEQGGARSFAHLPQADTHLAKPETKLVTSPTTNLLAEALPNRTTAELATLPKAVSEPRLQSLYASCSQTEADAVLNCLAKIDAWDYDVFAMEQATDGNALFYTTYAILLKLNLIADLKIDDKMLRSFLMHVQAGYHPNPYHNKTHAADVTHINYFILHKAGLATKCKLSNEELFAAVVGGAIHDFDHPGFNNSFHTRTNAYLATLYNDRSVLENHHLACVWEMMRRPELNIVAHMTDDQKKEIRDTMIEIVLATDMGMHGKIYGQFRRRLTENPDWSGSKDDIRLALSMSLKMADTANPARPTSLYKVHADRIAAEFYQQGDVEAQLCLPISPYMDRRKEKEEFGKGQIFFINVVVLGMCEKMTEMLPPLDIAVRYCVENKEYWAQS